jgi:ABC-type Co2+ transport system permease subunit
VSDSDSFTFSDKRKVDPATGQVRQFSEVGTESASVQVATRGSRPRALTSLATVAVAASLARLFVWGTPRGSAVLATLIAGALLIFGVKLCEPLLLIASVALQICNFVWPWVDRAMYIANLNAENIRWVNHKPFTRVVTDWAEPLLPHLLIDVLVFLLAFLATLATYVVTKRPLNFVGPGLPTALYAGALTMLIEWATGSGAIALFGGMAVAFWTRLFAAEDDGNWRGRGNVLGGLAYMVAALVVLVLVIALMFGIGMLLFNFLDSLSGDTSPAVDTGCFGRGTPFNFRIFCR